MKESYMIVHCIWFIIQLKGLKQKMTLSSKIMVI